MLILLLFAFLLLGGVFGTMTRGNKAGGEVCDFKVKYACAAGACAIDRPTFTAHLSLNATGYYQTSFQYRPWDDTCGPLPGSWEEQGVASFSFSYQGVGYSRDNGTILYHGPWFRHFPVGLPAALMDMDVILEEYFQYFIFVANDGMSDTFWPCCDSPVCTCLCGPGETLHCIDSVQRTDCYDNTIPFAANTAAVYFPDGTFEAEGDLADYLLITCGQNFSTDIFAPVIIAEGSGVIYKDSHHNNIDLSNELCPDGTPCWYFHQTPNWNGAELNLYLTMDAALGQAQRLQLQIHYQSLPNNKGPVCVYFDYSGIDRESSTEFDDMSLNKIWCGELQPYNSGYQALTLTLPLTYGPASEDMFEEQYYSQGYDLSRPIMITGNQGSSFVIYDVTVNDMGEGMQDQNCLKKRRQGDPAPSGNPVITPANYSQYIHPVPDYQKSPSS
jgi:hypothetical protein